MLLLKEREKKAVVNTSKSLDLAQNCLEGEGHPS